MNTAQVADFEEGEKENCAIGGTEDGAKKDCYWRRQKVSQTKETKGEEEKKKNRYRI